MLYYFTMLIFFICIVFNAALNPLNGNPYEVIVFSPIFPVFFSVVEKDSISFVLCRSSIFEIENKEGIFQLTLHFFSVVVHAFVLSRLYQMEELPMKCIMAF